MLDFEFVARAAHRAGDHAQFHCANQLFAANLLLHKREIGGA